MPVKYESIIPWGRNLQEYRKMFSLTPQDERLSILDCASGPSSFNAECTQNMGKVISIDPIYVFSKEQIQARIAEVYEEVLTQTIANKDKYIWKDCSSPIQLGVSRMTTMRKFLADYENGKQQGRYITGELPALPFEKESFGLVLCSHFLFLYSDLLDYNFHVYSLQSMLKAGKEVRIFPLVDQNGKKSPYLKKLKRQFSEYNPKIIKVDYEFQKKANEMLVLKVPYTPTEEEDDYYKEMRRKYG